MLERILFDMLLFIKVCSIVSLNREGSLNFLGGAGMITEEKVKSD